MLIQHTACHMQLFYSCLPPGRAQKTGGDTIMSITSHVTSASSVVERQNEQTNFHLIDDYLHRLDWKVKENSNMAYSLQGLNNYVASQLTEAYWLHRIYTEPIRTAHQSGDLHIHDLGLLSVYCVGWDLEDLLHHGFRGAPGKAESGPARHFSSALGQMVNFFYTLQGEAAGAQAFSNVDTLLAPFIRYDNLSYTAVKQAIQEFVFNLNVPTRVGFQTPFTNITLDIQPPAALANTPVCIGGQLQDACYGEFQAEMDMFNKAFIEVMAAGDAKGRVFTFPIPTYNITPDFNWDAPELHALWEAAAKYGIPYFANFINSDMNPDDTRSMCCRLRLDTRELMRRGGGLFGANPLTGSIGVVTINMPRLGYLATDEADFFRRLDEQMALAKESLEIKRRALEEYTANNLYPYTRYYLRHLYEEKQQFWYNHFSTIGLVGLNEASVMLLQTDIGSSAGQQFADKVLLHMRERLQQFQEETGNLYNLEATPAEATAYRLARLDKAQYPDITTANDASEPFYTNSSQLPVNFTDDVWKMLDLQDELQTRYTGGTVQHVFLGEAAADPQAVKSFVRAVCANYRLPYFTITPSFSVCPIHGYIRGEVPVCADCQQKTEVYSRVVGYLRPVDQWNDGKQAEFAMRSHYDAGM